LLDKMSGCAYSTRADSPHLRGSMFQIKCLNTAKSSADAILYVGPSVRLPGAERKSAS